MKALHGPLGFVNVGPESLFAASPPVESMTYSSGTSPSCAAATVASSNAAVSPATRSDLKDTIMADGEDGGQEKSRGQWERGRERRQVNVRPRDLGGEGSR
eukprot:TRINITY_DN1_c0_g1_i10.p2 TRINITY_DN1_c0_g1~~TRINITY_DN1_c0_g1_i10.p2  ORF type:complete len:101 (+),score=8.08 TRINITY_DN1_c0_g1_i10:315-617(+)